MSSSTRPPDPSVRAAVASSPLRPGVLFALRVLLVLLYPLLAHLAGARHDGVLAAFALADIAVIVLLEPLLDRRPGAWAVLALVLVLLVMLARSHYALLPLLLVPVAFIGLVAWTFGRTLRPGRVPLITRIVAALDRMPAERLGADLRRYTWRLTAAWAGVLALMALANFALALCAVPGGLLAGLGLTPAWTVSDTQWSWFANGLNYGIVVALFLLEFAYRQRRFPGRYRNLADFLGKVARLGPAFWRDLTR